ncbi:hypothetical protein ACXWOO_10640, partial [Streptococcus pyogenes]
RAQEDHDNYFRIIKLHQKGLSTPDELEAFKDYQSDVAIIRRGDLMNSKEEIKRSNRYENNEIIPTLSPQDKAIFMEVKTIYKYVI